MFKYLFISLINYSLLLDNGINGPLTGIFLADLGLCNRLSKGFDKPALFSQYR